MSTIWRCYTRQLWRLFHFLTATNNKHVNIFIIFFISLRKLGFFFYFNCNFMILTFLLLIIFISHYLIISILFKSLLPFHFLNLFPGMLYPCLDRNLEVHHGQEWVISIYLTRNLFHNLFLCHLRSICLSFSTHFEYSDLILEFNNLHLLIDFHCSVFTSHASIK